MASDGKPYCRPIQSTVADITAQDKTESPVRTSVRGVIFVKNTRKGVGVGTNSCVIALNITKPANMNGATFSRILENLQTKWEMRTPPVEGNGCQTKSYPVESAAGKSRPGERVRIEVFCSRFAAFPSRFASSALATGVDETSSRSPPRSPSA